MIKKWKEKQILFFFFKKHFKTHSQTLFSTFLSVPERKNKTKNQWQQLKKKCKKKALFFQQLIFFVFFQLLKLFFQQSKSLLFFFDHWSYFFNSQNFDWLFSTIKVIFSTVNVFLGFFSTVESLNNGRKSSWGCLWVEVDNDIS